MLNFRAPNFSLVPIFLLKSTRSILLTMASYRCLLAVKVKILSHFLPLWSIDDFEKTKINFSISKKWNFGKIFHFGPNSNPIIFVDFLLSFFKLSGWFSFHIALLELQALESIILPPDSATNSCPGKLCKVYKFREILPVSYTHLTLPTILLV